MRKIREKLVIFFVAPFLLSLNKVRCVDPSQCIAPLGMENGQIKDRDISASSSFDHKNVGPQHGRIRNELNGGAWCPQAQATPETKEWLEIDLHSVHMITATEIQGRFGNGQGVEFSETYTLEYYRPRLNKWVRYRTKANGHLLKGNVNTYLEEKSVLDPPIFASKIRFLPYSSHKRTVCLRVEVYGCIWNDGIVSYTMPQGDKRSSSWEFYDFAYDGHWDGEMLKYGLGQLVDGQTAPDDFKVPFYQENLQGWVGWKSDNRNRLPITLVFEFENLREFRTMLIYINNQFTKEIQVFSVAKIYFSSDGKTYKGDPISYEYLEDRIFENARNVSVKLHHRIGRFVKVELYFAARWILVSEINFESSVVFGSYIEEVEDNNIINKILSNGTSKLEENGTNKSNLGTYLGLVAGILMLLVLIICSIVLYVVFQQRKYKNLQRSNQVADKGELYGIQSLDLINMPVDYAEKPDSEYAVPLQAGYTSPEDTLGKPYDTISSSEQYYAAVEVCKPDFIPPPPPPCSPRPARIQSLPRYVMDNVYVGP